MDFPKENEKARLFITNVGLITSNGPHGNNIMSAEWTHQVSYKPGLIAVCVEQDDATYENIKATKEFGVCLASVEQAGMASVAGNNTGKEVDKIKALQEMGYKFYKAEKINVLMAESSPLRMECKVTKEIVLGEHVMFVGEIVALQHDIGKEPLAYSRKKFGQVQFNIPKPTDENRKKIQHIIEECKK